MSKIPYINYRDLKEFYTIPELCKLFHLSKAELKEKYEEYDTKLRRNEIGEFGFVRFDVRKLHNAIYHENDTNSGKEGDPWA